MQRRRLTKAEVAEPELRGLIYEIDEAATKMRAAEAEVEQQRARLYDAMQRGHAAGLGYRRLAEASGYSWQRAAQVVSARAKTLRLGGFQVSVEFCPDVEAEQPPSGGAGGTT